MLGRFASRIRGAIYDCCLWKRLQRQRCHHGRFSRAHHQKRPGLNGNRSPNSRVRRLVSPSPAAVARKACSPGKKAIGKEKKNRCRSRAWLRFARHKEQGKPTGISATGATAPFTLGHPCWMMDALILQPFQKLQRLGTRPRDLEAK